MMYRKCTDLLILIISSCVAIPLFLFKSSLLFRNDDIELNKIESSSGALKASIIAALSIMVPMILDSAIGLRSGAAYRSSHLTMCLGNAVPLLVFSTLSLKPDVLYVICQLRYLICIIFCHKKLSTLGGSLFRRWFTVACIVNGTSIMLFTWTIFSSTWIRDVLTILVWVGFVAGFIFLTCVAIMWFRKMSSLRLVDITKEDSCLGAYLISMEFVQIAFVIMLFIYGPCINEVDMPSYVTTCNYVSTVSVLLAWLLCGRIIRLDLKQTKVSNIVDTHRIML